MSARSTRGPGGGRVGGRRPPTRGARTRGSSSQSGCGMTAVLALPLLLPLLLLVALISPAGRPRVGVAGAADRPGSPTAPEPERSSPSMRGHGTVPTDSGATYAQQEVVDERS